MSSVESIFYIRPEDYNLVRSPPSDITRELCTVIELTVFPDGYGLEFFKFLFDIQMRLSRIGHKRKEKHNAGDICFLMVKGLKEEKDIIEGLLPQKISEQSFIDCQHLLIPKENIILYQKSNPTLRTTFEHLEIKEVPKGIKVSTTKAIQNLLTEDEIYAVAIKFLFKLGRINPREYVPSPDELALMEQVVKSGIIYGEDMKYISTSLLVDANITTKIRKAISGNGLGNLSRISDTVIQMFEDSLESSRQDWRIIHTKLPMRGVELH